MTLLGDKELAAVNPAVEHRIERAWLRHFHETGEKLHCKIDGETLTPQQMEARIAKIRKK